MSMEPSPGPGADPQANEATLAFAGRLFEAGIAAMDILSVYLGDRLGLYRALATTGPVTPAELAASASINGRYAQEWLEQQAATGILEVDDTKAAPDALVP